ncbi:MAG: hypothetical protein DRN27_09495 [Thermoplasmata archaeon]|nr:MAG: hypothetical protein DRN27_09495 [Thermoplasmata archaeon]
MGFSLTGTHVIFFVASVIAAGAISGVFMAVSMNAGDSFSKSGVRLQEQLDTEFKIINDNENIPNIGGNYRFYLKNIGEGNLITTNETFQIFVDGEIISTLNYNFSDTLIWSGEYTTMYVVNSVISAGNHNLRIVGPQAVEDEFEFKI